MHVLIIGLGYTGIALAKQLIDANHSVVGLKRSKLQKAGLAPLIVLQGDLHDAATLGRAPRGITHIVYALSPSERSDKAYRLAYPAGVEVVRQSFPQARFVFISSTSVYAQDQGEIIDEHSPALSPGFAAQRLREAEGLVLEGGRTNLVLRSSGIYGPGRSRLVSRLLYDDLDEESRRVWTNRIHRDDLARAIHFLLERSEVGGIFIASDSTPAQLGSLQDWLRDQEDRHLLKPNPSSLTETRKTRRKSRRAVAKGLFGLGFRCQYPSFKEGYAELLSSLVED